MKRTELNKITSPFKQLEKLNESDEELRKAERQNKIGALSNVKLNRIRARTPLESPHKRFSKLHDKYMEILKGLNRSKIENLVNSRRKVISQLERKQPIEKERKGLAKFEKLETILRGDRHRFPQNPDLDKKMTRRHLVTSIRSYNAAKHHGTPDEDKTFAKYARSSEKYNNLYPKLYTKNRENLTRLD